MAADYYAVLGVSKDATAQEIKKAFRAIARECHPDVAGADPAKERRFKDAKEAYETLGDDVARARYDRREERRGSRVHGASSFREAFYRRAAGTSAGGGPTSGQRTRKRVHDPGNDLDLDDLFNDFGFGRPVGGRPKSGGRPKAGPRPEPQERADRNPQPHAGRDVHIDLDVPDHIARDGGIVTAVYYRMQRADSWRPGSTDPGVVRIQDLADVRLLPGTRDGEVLHEKGKGDAGTYGGPYGDLVVRVRVIKEPRAPGGAQHGGSDPWPAGPSSSSAKGARPGTGGPSPEDSSDRVVEISVAEAILGGRIQVDTPGGAVRVTVPAGTSSGARMRLKGKGPPDSEGRPTDLYLRLRIVVPRDLDAESRELIERFAALNPMNR